VKHKSKSGFLIDADGDFLRDENGKLIEGTQIINAFRERIKE
jgi:hypothetical protein